MKSIVLDKIFAMIGDKLFYQIRFYRKLGLNFEKIHIVVTQNFEFLIFLMSGMQRSRSEHFTHSLKFALSGLV